MRVRMIAPVLMNEWHDVENESELQDLHLELHETQSKTLGIKTQVPQGEDCVYFALFEVKYHDPLISKILWTNLGRFAGLGRKGGVMKNPSTIEDVSRGLGWSRDPAILMTTWDHEETQEEAKERMAQLLSQRRRFKDI